MGSCTISRKPTEDASSPIRVGQTLKSETLVPQLHPLLPQSFKAQILDYYELGPEISSGDFSTISHANRICTKGKTARHFVVKSINTAKLSCNFQKVRNEIRALRKVDHPNVVKLYEVYNYQNKVDLVTEKCEGGTLNDVLQQRGHLEEASVKRIMHQLCSAVSHLHCNSIVHGNIQPQNILLSSENLRTCHAKLAGFGSCTFVRPINQLRTRSCNTTQYSESQEDDIGFEADTKALGAILISLLTGTNFSVSTDQCHAMYDCSPDVKRLLVLLMDYAGEIQPDWESILADSWLRDLIRFDNSSQLKILINYTDKNRFRQTMWKLVLSAMPLSTYEELSIPFLSLADIAGYITPQSLSSAACKIGSNLLDTDALELIRQISGGKMLGTSSLSYSQFLCAFLSQTQELSEEILTSVFSAIDTRRSGILTCRTIRQALLRGGVDVKQHHLSQMMTKHSGLVEADGVLTYKEFKILMSQPGQRETGSMSELKVHELAIPFTDWAKVKTCSTLYTDEVVF